MAYEKGARVTILRGQGKDKSGSVFWKGPNKYGSGERLGIRGDDGETYWSADEDVEAASGKPPPVEAGPTFAKGDRVAFSQRGTEGTGTVFWIGDSKSGPGQRLGIRDDANEEEAVWIDARQARALTDEPAGAPAARPAPAGDDEDQDPIVYAPAVSLDERPEPPPIDDSYADQWAESDEDGW